jgi:predicted transcriptional regulator
MDSIANSFRQEVEGFLAETGMKPSNFGFAAANDPSFIARLKAGRDFKASTIDRVREYMRHHREAA